MNIAYLIAQQVSHVDIYYYEYHAQQRHLF